MRRRTFLTAPVVAGMAPAVHAAAGKGPVVATGDGITHTPEEFSALLQNLAGGLKPDSYSLGGIVATLEERVAAALGKEAAVWVPTGTLANQLAVRLLAGERRRVLVQQECHLYNDCGDCCQTLSGLHLIPLAPGQATFTVEDAQRELDRTSSARVAVPIGAMQIETPVRRKTGEVFDYAEMKRVVHWARERKIGLHLDGARLYLAAAYSRVPVREYAALFDTVYVSMYKYFNGASGAVLAGPKNLLENLYHTRRMFGGGLCHAWPFAAVALHYFEGFPERYTQAVAAGERVIGGLESSGHFEVKRVPNGTNIFYLRVKSPEDFQKHALKAGLVVGPPQDARFNVMINETWNRVPPGEILDRFRAGLS